MARSEPARPEAADNPMSPEVATMLLMLAVDSLLWAWQRQRVRMAARMYRMRRELVVALDSDGGVKALVGRSVPGWLKRPGAPGRAA